MNVKQIALPRRLTRSLPVAFAVTALWCQPALSATYTWGAAAGAGNWTSNTPWGAGTGLYPGSAATNDTAAVGGAAATPAVVTIDSAIPNPLGTSSNSDGMTIGGTSNQVGTVNVATGGVLNVTGFSASRLTMGNGGGATATLNISGGTYSVNDLRMASPATPSTSSINVTSGTLNVALAQNNIGNANSSFSQSGGTSNFTGRTQFVFGTWGLSGTGTFNATGDRLSFAEGSSQSIAASMSGGTLNVSTTGTIGMRLSGAGGTTTGSTATFNQTGGTVNVFNVPSATGRANLTLGEYAATTATGTVGYGLSGTGKLAVQDQIRSLTGTPGTAINVNFNFTGGTLVTGSFNTANVGYSSTLTGTTAERNILFQQGGTIAPGDLTSLPTAGRMVVTGNYRNENGTVRIDVSGTTQANAVVMSSGAYDLFQVNGSYTLGTGSTLEVALIDGFVPLPSTVFTVVSSGTANARTGTFSNAPTTGSTLLTVGGLYSFQVNYTSTAVQITNFQSAIPEPASLLGLGLFGALAIRRRARKA